MALGAKPGVEQHVDAAAVNVGGFAAGTTDVLCRASRRSGRRAMTQPKVGGARDR